jgi:Na+/alanine symporter
VSVVRGGFAASVFTVYFGAVQFRKFGLALQIMRGRYTRDDEPGEISHFQALSSAVSGTVGLGNIAGVDVAVTIGGAGATFWMIVAGLLGMCTKFVECTLGVRYRASTCWPRRQARGRGIPGEARQRRGQQGSAPLPAVDTSSRVVTSCRTVASP